MGRVVLFQDDNLVINTGVRAEQQLHDLVNLLEGQTDVSQHHVLLLSLSQHLELPVEVPDGALEDGEDLRTEALEAHGENHHGGRPDLGLPVSGASREMLQQLPGDGAQAEPQVGTDLA